MNEERTIMWRAVIEARGRKLSMVEPVWSLHGFGLYWRDDCWNNPDRALFINGLCIGEVYHPRHNIPPLDRSWRAWIVDNADSGNEIGWYATEQEAKDACVDRAIALLNFK